MASRLATFPVFLQQRRKIQVLLWHEAALITRFTARQPQLLPALTLRHGGQIKPL